MGTQTQAWYEWLQAWELREVKSLDDKIRALSDQLVVERARRQQFMRRAENRRSKQQMHE